MPVKRQREQRRAAAFVARPTWHGHEGAGEPKRAAIGYRQKEQPRAGINASTEPCIIKANDALRRLSLPPPSEQTDGTDAKSGATIRSRASDRLDRDCRHGGTIIEIDVRHVVVRVVIADPIDVVILHEQHGGYAGVGEYLAVRVV
jgi:hypothetical protein